MKHESGHKAVNAIQPASPGKLRSRMLTSAVIATLGLAGFGAVAAGPAIAEAASPGAGGALTGVLAAPVDGTTAENAEAPEADGKKIAFCHRTASETNPYVSLETSINAFYNSGHISHTGPVFPEVGADGFWGDIFPPNEFSPAGQNWTATGQAIFANGCNLPVVPTPTETTPAPTETTPAPTETTPAPTETTPAPTETTPAPEPTETTPAPEPTETSAVPTETTPAPTESTPAPTETTPAPTDASPVTTTDATTPAAASSAPGRPSTVPAAALAQTGASGPVVFGIGGAALMLVGAAALWRTRRAAGSH